MKKVFSLSAIISVVVALSASGGEGVVKDRREEAVDQVDEVLPVGDIHHETGFSYIARLTGGRPGDNGGPPSVCVLLEDGKPLPSPRALHEDIRNKGKGHYSHWTEGSLYFSASDNSDPRANGRKYVLSSKQEVTRHVTTVKLGKGEDSYRIDAPADRRIANQRLIIRNLDAKTTVVPRLALKGWPDLSSSEGILASILKPGMNDEQKTLAIWKFLVDWRYHFYPAEGGDEIHDPVKFINVYGYGFCDDSAQNAAALASLAGIRSRIWGLDGHVVAETFFGDRWHMIDPDHEAYYRMPEGHIASVEELAAYPEIIQKTKLDPIGSDTRTIADLYTTTHNNDAGKEKKAVQGHRLDPQLGPGDKLVFDLRDQSAFHAVIFADQGRPPGFANGKWLRQLEVKRGAAPVHVEWPYAILGGELRWKNDPSAGKIAVGISADGKEFAKLSGKTDGGTTVVALGDWMASRKQAVYEYWLQVELVGEAAEVNHLELSTKFQFAPRALAQVQAGGTQFELFLRTPGELPLSEDWKGLEIVHEWQEASD